MGAVTLNDNNAKLDNLEKAIRAANERRRKLIEKNKLIQLAYFLNIKGFFFPIIIYKTVNNSPIAQSGNAVTPGILLLHGFKHLFVSFIQPFITHIIGGHGKGLVIRVIKEPGFDPVVFIPRVEGQGYLFKQSFFSRDRAANRFVKSSRKSSFKTWLYAIGRNITAKHFRKFTKLNVVPLESQEYLADEENIERNYIKSE